MVVGAAAEAVRVTAHGAVVVCIAGTAPVVPRICHAHKWELKVGTRKWEHLFDIIPEEGERVVAEDLKRPGAPLDEPLGRRE